MTKLTIKQEAFCLAYAKSGNATQSYKEAGYNVKNDGVAGVMAHRLLKNAKIKQRLAELAEEVRTAKIADIREVQETLTAILRGEQMEDQIVVEGCGDGISEAKHMDRQPQLKDRIKAGELLAKMQGGFDNTMKIEMTVPVFGGEEDLED